MFRKVLSFRIGYWLLVISYWLENLITINPHNPHLKTIIFCLTLLSVSGLSAQTKRAELELNRQKILQKIQSNTVAIAKTKQKQADVGEHVEALQNQIEDREALILNLDNELENTDSLIERTEFVIKSLQTDLVELKKEYGIMMRKAYRMRVPNNAVTFLFASQNFRQSYQRWQYFMQYEKFRKREAQLIAKTQQSLTAKNTFFARQHSWKDSLINTYGEQAHLLETERNEQDALVKKLKNTEEQLTNELKLAERQSTKISRNIEKLIASEIAARKHAEEETKRKEREALSKLSEAKKEKKDRKNKKIENSEAESERIKPEILTDSPQTLELSSDFRSNKGKLPPPAVGAVVRAFGKQRVLNQVTAINNGIDIRTTSGSDAHAVAAGTVSVVSNIQGVGQIVLIQHGNYYTVYANLSAAYVKKGEIISARQAIGKVAINPISNEPELHFELWLERTHLNPTDWLSK